MPTVPFCDILSVSVKDQPQKKSPPMSRQSARVKSKTAQNGMTQVACKDSHTGNKLENGYDVKTFYSGKASIDILSEVNHNSSRKRKGNFEKKNSHDNEKRDAAKQIKLEEKDEENLEFESCDSEENFEELSEYEKMREKNIAEKMAFFAALNFEEVKQELVEAAIAVKNTNKPKEKPKRLHLKKEERLTSVRKSLRLQRLSPENKPLPKLEIAEPVKEHNPRKPHKPLTFHEVFKSEKQNPESLIKDMSELSQADLKFEPVHYRRYDSFFDTMRINSSLVTKVAPSRIFSVAVHPSPDKTLVCAGSKFGHLSFWDVESKNPQGGVYVYEPHSGPVNCVAFRVNKPDQVISLSYDGTARCGHLEAGVFEEVFYTNDDDSGGSTYFDFLSPDSLIISLNSGEVAIADMRTPRHEEIYHMTHPCVVKTVSVHPLQKDYFVAAGRNGVVSLWDLRSMKKKSIADMVLSRSVNSAFFSPVTGNSVLTTSMDDKLCVFDTTRLKGKLNLKTAIRHDNWTGRWLTQFKAMWLPNNEDAFVVGSMQHPRRIEVFRINGKLAHNFAGEDLASVCSINAFHPSKPVLAGGNSSGKIHVFKGKQ